MIMLVVPEEEYNKIFKMGINPHMTKRTDKPITKILNRNEALIKDRRKEQ